MKLVGPFKQVIRLDQIKTKGAIDDGELNIVEDAGILINDNNTIERIEVFEKLLAEHKSLEIEEKSGKDIVVPAFVDAHTHICFAGTRARDYAMRNAGKTYLQIAKEGGGIMDTVRSTRNASIEELVELTNKRIQHHLLNGVTSIEIKSGYGLSVEEEIKMLSAIKEASRSTVASIIPTCLAAHIFPKDFQGSIEAYLKMIVDDLFPQLLNLNLCKRIDAFIEEEAFNEKNIGIYFNAAKELGFDITVHADQFHTGGSKVAIDYGAISADHLEASTIDEIKALAKSNVIPVALPGASIGLGCAFTPARKLLDHGCSLAIASDWNPGSGPMGDLLTSATILQTFEKLSNAEVLAGLTFRAANALNLNDRGRLSNGSKADFISFPTSDYREVFYHQGQMKPKQVWVDGVNLNA